MIITQYQVEVDVPSDVFSLFGGTDDYANTLILAKSEALVTGRQDWPDGSAVEWAVFHKMYKAQECEKRLSKAVAALQARVPDKYANQY